jgi:hypothetical protein
MLGSFSGCKAEVKETCPLKNNIADWDFIAVR